MDFTPVLITLAAGLATALGAVAVREKRNSKLEAVSMAFATGLVLTISVADLLPEAAESIGWVKAVIAAFAGIGVSVLLDVLFPHHHEHGEEHGDKEPGHFIDECECTHSESVHVGMIIALLLHNIIEGLATGVIAAGDLHLGLSMAVGIAIHNIPIGATLAISVMSSGKKKSRAVLTSTLVGLSQPVGALVGMLFAISGTLLDLCTALVAGIILFIAFDELWPAARRNGNRTVNIVAMLAGAAIVLFL